MTKPKYTGLFLLPVFLPLTGCGPIGEKSASMSIIYGATTITSLLLLVGYCFLARKKDLWYLLLFSAIFVANAGYLILSLSSTLSEALMANRISYLGSAFLPLAMLMIILRVCCFSYRRWLSITLLSVSLAMFLLAASPGYLDIYYRSATLTVVNGVTVLEKVYGPAHSLYLYYLLSYFGAIIFAILRATVKRKIASNNHAIILACAVFVNIGVWLLEQLVKMDFEFLSVSYIISGLFLLSLCLLLQDRETSAPSAPFAAKTTLPKAPERTATAAQCTYFAQQLHTLTPTEQVIYGLYLQKKSTKEVLQELDIKENTLKYHNKNIYGKLGVSSRKQLLEIAETLKNRNSPL